MTTPENATGDSLETGYTLALGLMTGMALRLEELDPGLDQKLTWKAIAHGIDRLGLTSPITELVRQRVGLQVEGQAPHQEEHQDDNQDDDDHPGGSIAPTGAIPPAGERADENDDQENDQDHSQHGDTLVWQSPAAGAYTIQQVQDPKSLSKPHYRVSDGADNRIATCYEYENALLVCTALNHATGEAVEWNCGHTAAAMCAECYTDLARRAQNLAESYNGEP